jgi:zinc transport system substrate-binding protein
MVVGDRYPVVTLLPPGRSPHDFEPAPANLKRMTGAVLFVEVGSGVDSWMRRAAEGVTETPSRMVTLARPGDDARDPHLWLDLDVVTAFLPRLAERMAAVDPDSAAAYRRRARNALDSLAVFDEQAKRRLAPVANVPFALLHPAFQALVTRYGMDCVAVLERNPEGETAPRRLGDASTAMTRAGVRCIFAEPQLGKRTAQAMVQDTGAAMALLDPLGGPDLPGRDTYLNLLRWNVAQLVLNLGRAPGDRN